MKKFILKNPLRVRPVEFTEDEVRESDDFADPEREDILALEVGGTLKLSDGFVVTRES